MTESTFKNLGLNNNLLAALNELGYEKPTPIQEVSIPVLLSGQDISAQAQTGTGKTAAFALPILNNIDLKLKAPQALVIAPTRELAIQVAEAFQSYAKHMKDFHVTPIYGGQDYTRQLKALSRGSHVIVGTPGRVMDHMRRESLSLENLKTLVLDEADEMLRMGFVEDVEWILEQIKHEHQTALFSATMPSVIQKIAKRYLKQPQSISIEPKKSTVDAISQFYMQVANKQKLEALTRYFEVSDITASIIFVRTKNISMELAEKLQARGFAASALNGDMNQAAREKVVDRIKSGSLDLVVATDVAARGIDVDRISHVINYDIPYDVESYIHRIGRTGRAGRTGTSLLFVNPRENRLLKDIERTIGKTIKKILPPSISELSAKRDDQLISNVMQAMVSHNGLENCYELLGGIVKRAECTVEDVAAAFIYMFQQKNPLPRHEISETEEDIRGDKSSKPRRRSNAHPKDSSRRSKPSGDMGRPRAFKKERTSFSDGDERKPRRAEGRTKTEFSADGRKPKAFGDRKRPDFSADSRKPKAFGERKKSDFSVDGRKPRSSGDERGSKFSEDSRKPKAFGDRKRPDFSADSRKPRSSGDERGSKFSEDSRKPKAFGERKKSDFSADGRKPRSSGDERGSKFSEDSRKPKAFGERKRSDSSVDGRKSRSSGDETRGGFSEDRRKAKPSDRAGDSIKKSRPLSKVSPRSNTRKKD